MGRDNAHTHPARTHSTGKMKNPLHRKFVKIKIDADDILLRSVSFLCVQSRGTSPFSYDLHIVCDCWTCILNVTVRPTHQT